MAGHIADSGSVEWNTPEDILEAVRDCFGPAGIVLDPCSNENSLVHAQVEYRLPERDGLRESWSHKTIYVNPPFGRCAMHKETKAILAQKAYRDLPKEEKKQYRVSTIKNWIEKCAGANADWGSEVIALIPAAVDTAHWQETIFNTASAVCFIKGRIKFVGAEQGAPMACALVYWGQCPDHFVLTHAHLGRCIKLDN